VCEFVADLLVQGEVLVELESLRRLAPIHEVQLVNYLVPTRKDVGLLINFCEEKVEVKRKAYERRVSP
jgi:GxxExxY protein